MYFQKSTVSYLLLFCTLLSSKVFSADNDIEFDTEALRARGIDTRIAEWFREAPRFMPGDNTVALTVNGNNRGKTKAHFSEQGKLCLTDELIKNAGLITPQGYSENVGCFDLKMAWPQSAINFYPSEGKVSIVVPQQAIASTNSGNWQHGGTAVVLNYDAQYSGSSGNDNNINFGQIGTEAGFNMDDWIFRSKQTFTRFNGDDSFDFQSAYAQRSFPNIKKILQAGQINLSNSMFGTGQVVGIQIFPEPALQSNQQGAGRVNGIADTQSVVEVRQSGVLVYSTTVPAGPFNIQGISLLNTRTDLNVKVTGTQGNVQQFVVPASTLLLNGTMPTPGLSYGIGKLNQSGSDISPLLATAAIGGQLTEATIYNVGVLGSESYQAMAANLNFQPLQATILSFQATVADDKQHDEQGISGIVTASYNWTENMGVSVNYSQQNEGYRELSDSIQYDDVSINSLTKHQTGAGISWSPKDIGALSLSWSRSSTFSGNPYTYFTASWSRQFERAYIGISLQHNVSSGDDNNSYTEDRAYFTLNIPFGKRSVSSYINSGRDSSRTGLRYSERSGQDRGWSLATERDYQDHTDSITGSVDFVTASNQFNASLGRSKQDTNWSARASGALVAHTQGITLTPYQVGDTFGIAKVGDEEGVKLDTPAGPTWTNSQGYAVLSTLAGYRNSNIQVDTRSLAKNVDIDNAWQETETARGAVTFINFGIVKTRRVLVDLKDSRGNVLQHGASVFEKNGKFVTVVGSHGEVFISDAHSGMKLDVQQAGMLQCSFKLVLPEEHEARGFYETAQSICK
ncbi:fimbria/pilus outer membrane usher protein [Serratia quinivorans]|uniref:fimbria/pilus outer membrane usher protein n=1 Tax=Serratia quinivorans TaxID=137545 RepID=UPI0034C64B35